MGNSLTDMLALQERKHKKYRKQRKVYDIFYRTAISNYIVDKLWFNLLKTLPMIGPRTNKAAITMIATRTRINAYSTRPWPFSAGKNNIGKSPFFWISREYSHD
jgi:hypothetical protein